MVVAPVVAPVSPVAPCAGQGGFMTTDLKQFCGLPSTTIKIMVDPIPMMKTLRQAMVAKKTPICFNGGWFIPWSWYC